MSNRYDECFTERCPPLQDTFSGQAHPCPVQLPSADVACPHSPYCKDEWQREGERRGTVNLVTTLASSYQGPVHITLAEPSGSFVIRSEHHFHGRDMSRMSIRRHLYEVLAPTAGPGSFPPDGRCPALGQQVQLGHYLGFVDLRQHYHTATLALGILSVPRYLRDDPDARVIVGIYGQLFGGPAFPGTIYSRQDNNTAGAACAQACIIMVSGMLADRGARLEGSFTLTQLGYDEPTRPWGGPGGEGVQRVFPATMGLTPGQVVRVLNRLAMRASLVVFPRPAPGPHHDQRTRDLEKLAQRMIECHIQARYPVILGVEPSTWAENVRLQAVDYGHAVTVVGIRKASFQRREDHFVVHDPAKQPFLERSVSFCFKACWKSPSEEGSRIEMILPTERAVQRPLIDCLLTLQRLHLTFFNTLIRGSSRHHKGRRFDYQFALLYRKDIHSFLWTSPLRTAERQDIDGQLSVLDADRYWCVAGYIDGRMLIAWFFAANGENRSRPQLQLFRNSRGRHFIIAEDGTRQFLRMPERLSHGTP